MEERQLREGGKEESLSYMQIILDRPQVFSHSYQHALVVCRGTKATRTSAREIEVKGNICRRKIGRKDRRECNCEGKGYV